METSVLAWLCVSGGLNKLQEQCQKYLRLSSEQKTARIFTFTLTIDVMLLLEYDAKLGELVLHHPSSAWPLFQQVCYRVLLALKWLPELKSPSQLLFLIHLLSFPSLPGYMVEHVSELPTQSEEPRFYYIAGVIHSLSIPEKYTENAVFSCPTEGCSDGKTSNSSYISVHVTGANEASTVGREFTCYTCGSQLVEDVSCRTLADKIYLMLVPYCTTETVLSHCSQSWRQQGVRVVVRRELCNEIRLGSRVSVVGVPTHRLSTQSLRTHIDTTIEANNIMETSADVLYPLNVIPDSITDILKACQYSPWVFSATLAFTFAADICPRECYYRLKMVLLLSVVSSGSKLRENAGSVINLLVYGSDLKTIYQLLLTGSSLASNSIHHNSRNDLIAAYRKSKSGIYIDGGSLLLADGGVCVLDYLTSYKKEIREMLQKALETNEIGMNMLRQSDATVSGSHDRTWKLNCTIWAHVDQQHKKRQYVLGESSVQDTSPISKVLADQFSLVVINDPIDLSAKEHLHDIMMTQAVNTSRGHLSWPMLLLADLRQFLIIASQIEVKLSDSTSELLRAFYVASRKVRVSPSHGTDMPIKALSAMNAIACAHAKMNLRNKTIVEDAIIAIFLYEESLTSRFGYSVLGVSPCPHFKLNTEATLYVTKEFDDYLRTLHKQIMEFCSFHGIPNVHQREE